MGGLVGTIVKRRSVFVGGLWLLAMACQPNEDTRHAAGNSRGLVLSG